MVQKRKSLKRNKTNRKFQTRKTRTRTRNHRNGRHPRRSLSSKTPVGSNRRLFEWSSILPKASIKSKTRFNLKNDWGLRVKGVLKI